MAPSIVRHRRNRTRTRPAESMTEYRQYNFATDSAMPVSVQHGVVNLYQGRPTYRIEAFRFAATQVLDDVAANPSQLLAAGTRVVGFAGRGAELTDLRRWRDDPRLTFAARLIHGPAGQGKTRLATRFAEQSARAGWVPPAAHRYAGQLPDTPEQAVVSVG